MSKKMHFWQKALGVNGVIKWPNSSKYEPLGDTCKSGKSIQGKLKNARKSANFGFQGLFLSSKDFFYFSKYWPWNRGEQFPSTHILHRSLHFPKIQNAFLTPENNRICFLSFCYLCCHAMLSSICCVTHQISTANAIRRTHLIIIRWHLRLNSIS